MLPTSMQTREPGVSICATRCPFCLIPPRNSAAGLSDLLSSEEFLLLQPPALLQLADMKAVTGRGRSDWEHPPKQEG